MILEDHFLIAVANYLTRETIYKYVSEKETIAKAFITLVTRGNNM